MLTSGGTQQDTFGRIDTHTPYSLLSFRVPDNTSLLLMYGSVNLDHARYSVSLSDPGLSTPIGGESGSNTSTTPANQTFTGDSEFVQKNQVTYFATLDPATEYEVIVDFLGTNQSQYWDFSEVVFLSTNRSVNDFVAACAASLTNSVRALVAPAAPHLRHLPHPHLRLLLLLRHHLRRLILLRG